MTGKKRGRICCNLDLPGEAALAVAASLLGRQDEGIGPAGKQQVPDIEGFGDPEPSTFPRALEPLEPLDVARHDSVLPEMTRAAGWNCRDPGGEEGLFWAPPNNSTQPQTPDGSLDPPTYERNAHNTNTNLILLNIHCFSDASVDSGGLAE